MKVILKIILFVLLPLVIQAQQTRVDFVITLLEKSRTRNVLDTVQFISACDIIKKTILTDSTVNQLEKEASKFIKANNEDLYHFIRNYILASLTATDKTKAIDFGKTIVEKLDAGTTPHKTTLRSSFLGDLRFPYRNFNEKIIEGIRFYSEKIIVYKQTRDSIGLSDCYFALFGFYRTIGLWDEALNQLKRASNYADTTKLYYYPGYLIIPTITQWEMHLVYNSNYVLLYNKKGEYKKALQYNTLHYYQNVKTEAELSDAVYTLINISFAKLMDNQTDSVIDMLKRADSMAIKTNIPVQKAKLQELYGLYYIKMVELSKAKTSLEQSRSIITEFNLPVNSIIGTLSPDYYQALISIMEKKYTEAAAGLLKDIKWSAPVRPQLLIDYKLLADIYTKMGKYQLSNEAYQFLISLQDSLIADQATYRSINFETEQQINVKDLSISKLQGDNKLSAISRNFTIGISILLLILAGSIYYRFGEKKKANVVLEKTLTDLKSTQSQLIQSEKMVSLGELTAGIAHEIQNPLNFVNNFSEVNQELLVEIKDEMQKGNYDEAKEIIENVIGNEEKINHHGKRADAIVKGMLQHTRSSTGVKEPTDINKLADEYLRLAYHGLRAKNKSFNATMKTDFDDNIGNINIIPQDIGRVILNLITNAFYVVDEKKKSVIGNYEPTVTISTKKINDNVEISVSDNGNGIPSSIKDKIFQPFFTTKPTGQGTGLGLSLAYDIVKAHGGELKVETKEGEGSTFTIQIPII